jgi:hypothetical protein
MRISSQSSGMTYNETVARQATLLEIERANMKTPHSTRWLQTLLLGAANGALFAITMFFLISRARDHFQRQYIEEATRLGAPIVQFGGNERWSSIGIVMILAFAFSAYAVSRFCKRRLGSLLFWELVGVIAVSGWNVFMLTVTWFEKELSAQTLTYDWVTSRSNLLYGPISLGVVILVNLIYGNLVRVFQR